MILRDYFVKTKSQTHCDCIIAKFANSVNTYAHRYGHCIYMYCAHFTNLANVSMRIAQTLREHTLLASLREVFTCFATFFFDKYRTPFQASKTEILEVRPRCFSKLFRQPERLFKKALVSPLAVFLLQAFKVLCIYKTCLFSILTAQILTVYLLYLCTRVRYDRTDSSSTDFFVDS